MAAKGDATAKGGAAAKAKESEAKIDPEMAALFKKFVHLSCAGKKLTPAEECQMTSKACGKMCKDCWPKDLVTIADASVFPKHKDKSNNKMPMEKFGDFIHDCAWEMAKKKEPKILKTDQKVTDNVTLLKKKLNETTGPDVKAVKTSTTGGVAKMTDTSQYTGGHKERFGEDGKGKGIDGREDRHEHTGYTGEYKGKDTHGKKK